MILVFEPVTLTADLGLDVDDGAPAAPGTIGRSSAPAGTTGSGHAGVCFPRKADHLENVATVIIEVHIGLKPDVDGRLSLSVTLDVGIDVPSQACGERVNESASTVRGYPDAIRGGIDATLGFPDDV